MHALLAILSLRTFLTFATTAFAIAIVMLSLNIITAHELSQILGIAGTDAEVALTKVIGSMQHMMNKVLNIISQLLNKVLDWSGVEVDLNKIDVDVNQAPPSGGENAPTPITSKNN